MSRELRIEPINDVFNCTHESIELNADVCPPVRFNIFRRYAKGELRLDVHLVREKLSGTNNFDPDNLIFSVERVAVQPFMSDSPTARGFGCEDVDPLIERQHTYNPQPPMTVKPGQVMDVLQGVLQPTIRVVARFISRSRLYRLHPVNELLREWKPVETVLVDVRGFPCWGQGELQPVQALCVGGKLGTLREGYCLPDQSIESSTELVRKLTEYERKLIGLKTGDPLGSEIESECPPPGMFIVGSDGTLSFSPKREAHSDSRAFRCRRALSSLLLLFLNLASGEAMQNHSKRWPLLYRPWHFLYFFPLLHGHGSFLPAM